MALLEVDGLRTHFFTDDGVLPSVDGVSFSIDAGETVGVVGESGCGKSVTAMSILQLVPSPPGKIVGGSIRFRDTDLTTMSARELRKIRGNEIAMVFQEPMSSLNPVYSVGDQLVEAIVLHQQLEPDEARTHALSVLEQVGISSPEIRIDQYPHQMSGGMKQRVMIAMALSCSPALLIADEPTTALDVTVQAQILDLLARLKNERDMALMLITHDLGVVAEVCERVIVMYAGRVVEEGSVFEIFERPLHPYTLGLLQSLPDRARPGARLPTVTGSVPAPLDFPSGCRFRDRCPRAQAECASPPPAVKDGPGHRAWCFFPESP
ncbi:MAG: ABC transporter ATP-binding protein [Myxococcota bacterium]